MSAIPLRLAPRRDWIGDAACAQVGHGPFDLEKGDNATEARKVCRECPVRQQCLDEAVTNAEPIGVWGGLVANQRRHYAILPKGQRDAYVDRILNPNAYKDPIAGRHGKVAGYRAHEYYGIPACQPCCDEWARYRDDLRKNQEVAAERRAQERQHNAARIAQRVDIAQQHLDAGKPLAEAVKEAGFPSFAAASKAALKHGNKELARITQRAYRAERAAQVKGTEWASGRRKVS